MGYAKYIYPIAVSLLLSYIYSQYKGREYDTEQMHTYDKVKKYLLTESSLARSKKPLIWIHLEYEKNARWWPSFGSRNTENLNQPYQYLTIKSIIDKCGEDFNVCLIDDDTFTNIIPGWAVNLNLLEEPIKSKMRQLALARVLHSYGGLLVPSSFLCLKNLKTAFDTACQNEKILVGEFIDRNSTSETINFFPSAKLLGCHKNNMVIANYITYLETIVSSDFTAESEFLGQSARWLNMQQNISIVSAEQLGVKDTKGAAITLDCLMGNTFIHLHPSALGLYAPYDEILNRTAYQWFARLSAKQVLESDTMLGKYILISRPQERL